MSYRSASTRARVFDDALREAMSASIPNAVDPQDAPASYPAAGTPRPEGVAALPVTPESVIGDADFEPNDRDRMEHERQARLRRWQAVDPRERKA